MRKFRISLIFVSLLVLLFVSVQSTLAYFYTYTESESTLEVELPPEKTDIKECVADLEKGITIVAEKDSEYVFVKIKIFAPKELQIDVERTENWQENEKGVEYEYLLPIKDADGERETDLIRLSISLKEDQVYNYDQFNVIVTYEATPALWDGSEWYPDWKGVIIKDSETITPSTEGGE